MRRNQLELSQTELGARAGLTQPTISALEKNRAHTSGSLASIAQALGVNALWLETGLGDMLPSKHDESPRDDADTIMVPLLECKGSCGNGRMYGDIDFAPIPVSRRVLSRFYRNASTLKLIALYADGDSMSNYIMHGDIIMFDMNVEDLQESGVYLLDTPEGLRVKRVNRRADGKVLLRSDSIDKMRYPDEEYSPDEAQHLIIKGKFVMRLGG
jgi:phage repressor protein C with HTH and peptisase S24 domain